jgi:hypothetical protein
MNAPFLLFFAVFLTLPRYRINAVVERIQPWIVAKQPDPNSKRNSKREAAHTPRCLGLGLTVANSAAEGLTSSQIHSVPLG